MWGVFAAARSMNTAGEGIGFTLALLLGRRPPVGSRTLFPVAALAIMHAGGANVLMPRFDAEQAVHLIDTHTVTYVTSFPPVLTNLLDAAARLGSKLPSLKHASGLEGPEAILRGPNG